MEYMAPQIIELLLQLLLGNFRHWQLHMDPGLYVAVANGDETTFENLIGQPVNRNMLLGKTSENNNVLHVAALNNRPNIVEKILQRWPTCCMLKQYISYLTDHNEYNTELLYERNSDGDTSLHLAARVGGQEIVQLLIHHENAEIKENVLIRITTMNYVVRNHKLTKMVNLVKDSALHDAVRNGHLSVVMILIKEDPELALLTNSAGESPLFLAVEGKFFDIAKYLLDNTKTCSLAGRYGVNALHLAVAHSQTGLLDYMIRKFPLAVNKEDDLGWTPLHYAVHLGIEEVIELLLQDDKSSAYKKDKAGMSAFHIATENEKIDIIKKLKEICPDIFELLAYNGETALHIAVRSKKKNIVEYLLSTMGNNLILNKKDKDGNTPLHLAAKIEVAKTEPAEKEDYGILCMLLDQDIVKGNFVNNDGLTAMDIFQSCNELEDSDAHHRKMIDSVIQKLASKGAFSYPKQQLIDRKIKTETMRGDGQSQLVKDKRNIKGVDKKFNSISTFFKNLLEPDRIPERAEELNVLLATLIATVSFAVTLQIPGGYESDGPYKGLPILRHKHSFKAFIILDAIAFSFSSSSIIFHFLSSMMPDSVGKVVLLNYAQLTTLASIFAMVSAFISGLYLMRISENKAVFFTIVGAFIAIIYFHWVKYSQKNFKRFKKLAFSLLIAKPKN